MATFDSNLLHGSQNHFNKSQNNKSFKSENANIPQTQWKTVMADFEDFRRNLQHFSSMVI